MAFNQVKFDAVKQEIELVIDEASVEATTFLPEFAAYILIGKAIAKLAPDIYEGAAKLIEGTDPSDGDVKDLATTIVALASPESQ